MDVIAAWFLGCAAGVSGVLLYKQLRGGKGPWV